MHLQGPQSGLTKPRLRASKMTRHPYLPFLLLWLIALLTPAGAEPLVEGRVRLDSGQPVAGAQVLLFDLADLRSPPVAAMTDESGWFALPPGAFPGGAVPERFELGANYPNPFNPSTIIPYQLPAPMHVRLEVFNVLGQRIATLVDGARPAGSHTASWEATDAGGRAVAAGVYLYRLSGGGAHLIRRMVLIDGQAGVAVAVSGGSAAAGAEFPEADKVYGLTVSGEGLVTYVDPAFRAEAGMAPLDIVVETPRGLPRAKVAAAAILGDVDNNGRADIFDALLVAVYSANPGLVMPNNGDIALGDVNRDGRTDLTDAYHIATYTVNPSDPTLPAGIGAAITQQPPPAGTAASKLYWSDWGTDKIHRADLDGSNVEDLVTTGLDGPDGLSLDLAGGKIYWADAGTNKIQRANLDGSGVEDLVTGLGIPYGLALDVSGGKMYWTNRQTNKIQRANLDGSSVEDLVTSGLTFPGGLALDVSGGKIYWTNAGAGKIQRSNLSGSSVEDLVTSGLSSPTGLALDVAGGKMYWTDRGTDKIQRSNLSGTSVEDLVTSGLNSPNGLALDVAGGKMYWADAGTDKVQRANLNGSGVEDLLTGTDGLIDPSGIALGGTTQTGGVGGGTGPAPDLIVDAPTVSSSSPTAGASFTLRATVRNQGSGRSASTTLRWYRSTDATVSTSDTEVGTDAVFSLSASRTSAEWISLRAPSSAGTYYYGACVESVSGESNTGNNCSSAVTVTVGAGPMPDLIVDAPTVSSSSPTAGASFTLRATVRNQGSGRSASTTLRYYRSTDATVSTSDTEIGTDYVSSLSASRTSAESISLTAPSAGTYYYGACVESVSGESNTGDNCSSAVTVTVGAGPMPDLIVDAPTVSSSSPTAGASFTLRATVRNQGSGRSASTTLRYYRSTDATVSTSDTEVGTDYVSSLSASRTSAESISLRAPSSAGTYYYGACVESVSGESNTGNNCSSAVTVTVGAAPAPDLIVDAPTVSSSSPTAGASFTLRATVRNQGSGRSASTTLRYYRSTDATVDTSDTEVGTDYVSSLSASRTSAESISLRAPSSAGTYYYGACVESVSGESNTGNNCSSAVTVTVGAAPAPDLIVDAPTVSPSSPAAGASFTLNATVRNQGNGRSASTTLRYYRSTDATVSTSDTEIGTDYVSSLSASRTSAEWISLRAPSSAGTYHYGACAESVSGESNTGNNCSSAVTVTVGAAPVPDLVVVSPAVSNSTPAAGTSFTLSATVRNQGNGQSPATTLRFYRSTDATISSSDTQVGTGSLPVLVAGIGFALSTNPTAPSSAGTYYYGACVESVSGESNTGNNCSSAVTVTVAGTTTDDPPGASKLYWSDWGTDKIQRSDLDGSNVEDLVTTGLDGPDGLSLDLAGGKIYWADAGTNKIRRSNLDGTGAEDLVTGLGIPYGLALDVSGSKMYWTNRQTNKIQRANLDGSSVEDLVTSGLTFPGGLALDVSGGKMYWTNPGARKIQRSNLSGSSVEDLVTSGLSSPTGLALDLAGGKMYWTDRGTDKIQRSNLSGTSVEDLVTSGLNSPNGLALDVSGGKMYWADAGTNKVQRANLNGSGVEDLLTGTDGLIDPSGIALGGTSDTGTGGGGGGGTGPAPDLIVEAPTVSNGSPTVGASFTLRATVRNQGSGRSASTTLRWYRSTDATISTSDTEVGTDGVSVLDPSRTGAESISLTAPSSVGTYYYGACVESVSDETDTGNNCSSAVTVIVGAAPAPDLVVDAPTVSNSSPTAGASLTLNATVRNQGNGRSASTTLRYYRSTDATVSTSDTEIGTDYVSSLSASRTSAESIGLRAPSSAGTYYYGGCVESVSGESNTGNNCSSAVTVTVGAGPVPDLIVDAPTVSSSSPTAGASFTLRATVRNQGSGRSASTTLRYYLSTDATVTTSDTEVGTDAVFSLSVSRTSAESIGLRAPSSAGTYYYGGCVESVSGESNTGNNCSSAVTVTVGGTVTPPDPQPGASKLYWSDWGTDKIQRSDLDGSNVEDLVTTGLDGPDGLSLDLAGGKIYWADAGTNKIRRSNLDGSGAQDLVTGLGIPYGLALDVSGGKMYWTNRQTNKIQRANLNGSAVEDLVTGGLTFPGALALDVSGGKIYWTNPGARKIQRSNLSGSSVEDLVTSGLSSPTGLALDLAGGKMYWTDRGTDKIQRSNLSGTSVEDLVTSGLNSPNGLALDVSGGKMYWADAGTDKVQRANLNGSGVEDLLTRTDGLIDPSGIAIGAITQTGGGGGGGTSPAPDLIVEAPTVSNSSPTVGASFTLRATVRNQGSGRSASTTLRYYRSTDATVSTSDTEVGTDAVSVLDASRTGAESISLTAPSSVGTYYYGACVESVSGETDTGNNCSSAVTVIVGAAPAPDLVVDAPTVSTSSPTAGASFTLRATVRNQGDGRSASTTLRYYRSTDATVSTSDTEVGTDAVIGLSASRTSAESISLTAPSSVGTYYYGACVESVSDETDTGNNCSSAVTVIVGAAPAPDLVVDAPTVSTSSPTAGASFTLRATVRNQGDGRSASTTLRYYRSTDATVSTSDTEVGTDGVSVLDPSRTGAESISLTAPSSVGTYYYGACVESVSDETDTGNNCSSSVTVTVGAAPAPDLVVDAPTVSNSSPTAGASFTLSATVRNQGNGRSASTTLRYYRSTDATVSTSDTEVGTDAVSVLDASRTGAESISLTAPSSVGTYYYGACVESVSGESDTENNCSSAVAVTVAETTPAGASKLYWSDWGTDKIQRADLDGSNVEDLVSGAGLNGPDGLSLDLAGGKIYWADAGTNKIQRADLDGSGVEDLVTGLGIPYGLGLDVAGGKMYWTNRQTGKIQRANLDGSGVEDLVTSGLTFPGALALDVAGGKMYWTNPGATKIQRADLSGSNVEDLVASGLSSPLGLALDVAGGKMYWTDRGSDKIQRADLSGSNVEDLVTSGLNSPNGLALDVTGGKMYWTDESTNKVQRANLNGSGVEDLLTSSDGLVDPSGIALGAESASSSSTTYGVGDALPNVPTGSFFPARLTGGASLTSSGSTTTITFDNGGQMELQDGTTYTCIATGGCRVENGRVTMGLLE